MSLLSCGLWREMVVLSRAQMILGRALASQSAGVGRALASQSAPAGRHMASWIPWRRKKDSEDDQEALDKVSSPRKQTPDDTNMTHQLKFLAQKSKVHNRREYIPPLDVGDKIAEIVRAECGTTENIVFKDRRQKYQVLSSLIEELGHDVPASTLSKMNTVEAAREYFSTPVEQSTPLDDLHRKSDLPSNLHIDTEYHRFDPETDSVFGGRTAYPGRDTVVTSIKYRRVYNDIKTTHKKPGYFNHYDNY